MKLRALKTDIVKAEQGVWIDQIPDLEDLRLKVRPTGNPDYRRVYLQLVEATPRNQKRGGVVSDPETKSNILARTLADTVLLGWENLQDDDGKVIPYTLAKAKELLLDPEWVAFRDAVVWAAEVAGEEVRGSAEDNAGN